MKGHMHDDPVRAFALADRLEWQSDGRDDTTAWDVLGWIGNDTSRLWLRSEGERSRGVTEAANVEALWRNTRVALVGRAGGRTTRFRSGEGAHVSRIRHHRARALWLRDADSPHSWTSTARCCCKPSSNMSCCLRSAGYCSRELEAKLFGRGRRRLVPRPPASRSPLWPSASLRDTARSRAPYAGVEWTRSGAAVDDGVRFHGRRTRLVVTISAGDAGHENHGYACARRSVRRWTRRHRR